MSAFGTKRTSQWYQSTSALRGKADMGKYLLLTQNGHTNSAD
jgi:hypothetical protein